MYLFTQHTYNSCLLLRFYRDLHVLTSHMGCQKSRLNDSYKSDMDDRTFLQLALKLFSQRWHSLNCYRRAGPAIIVSCVGYTSRVSSARTISRAGYSSRTVLIEPALLELSEELAILVELFLWNQQCQNCQKNDSSMSASVLSWNLLLTHVLTCTLYHASALFIVNRLSNYFMQRILNPRENGKTQFLNQCVTRGLIDTKVNGNKRKHRNNNTSTTVSNLITISKKTVGIIES